MDVILEIIPNCTKTIKMDFINDIQIHVTQIKQLCFIFMTYLIKRYINKH